VLGSVPRLDEWVALAAPPSPRLRLHSAVQPACPLRLPDRGAGACESLRHAAAGAAEASPDLVVVGLGPEDRAELHDELRRMTSEPERLQATLDALEKGRQLINGALDAFPDRPVLFVDTGPEDVLARELNEVDLQQERMTVSRPAAGTFVQDLRAGLAGVSSDRLRVLVIGDSTSYELAMALDAAGRDRMEVAWAGRSNCTIAPVDRLRWWKGSEHDGGVCPSTGRGWPEAAAALRPDVVVAAASLPALSEQRYAPVGPWTMPGEPAYVDAHDRAMADLQELAARYGAVTVLATIPPLLPGEGLNGELGAPERLAAWMSQLQRWDTGWRSVGIVDWAAIALQAEAEAGHDLRIDAVHFDDAAVAAPLAPRFTAAVLGVVDRVRAEAEQSGCRVLLPAPHLDLSRCRT